MRMGIGLGIGINRSNYAQGIFGAYQSRVIADGGITEAGGCVDAVSSLLQSASLLLIPSGYKSGKAYAEIPTNGNGDLTWTRASDAWRTNADGLIQRVPWNLLQRSEEFDNSDWTKVATTITSNATTAPNGTTTAEKIIPSATSSSHSVYQTNGAIGDTRTISCYIKKVDYRYVNLQYGTASSRFDFDTLTFVGGTNTGYDVLSNGWYRIYATLTATVNARATILIPDNAGNVSYVGDGTSGTFIWGAQVVEGSTAKPYFPTTDRLNVPRLTYQNGGGGCPALLLEPQRTNLALYSEQFDNAAWTQSMTSTTANQTTSPDGNTNADLINALTGTGQHFISTASINFTSGVAYTMSVFAKKGNTPLIQLFGASGIYGSNVWATYNFDTLEVTTGSAATASMVDYENGWYRLILTGTSISTSLASAFYAAFTNDKSVRLPSFTAANQTFYLWGAQTEQGAYPTTYIPTTSASATRIADSFSRNNIYTNGLITSSGGTWFVEFVNNIPLGRDSGANGLFLGNASTGGTNTFVIGGFTAPTTNRMRIGKFVSGVYSQLYVTTTTTVKIAIKWDGTSADIFANGTKVVSATSFTATNMEFLGHDGTTEVQKFIQAMALYPAPLSDTDCTTITSL